MCRQCTSWICVTSYLLVALSASPTALCQAKFTCRLCWGCQLGGAAQQLTWSKDQPSPRLSACQKEFAAHAQCCSRLQAVGYFHVDLCNTSLTTALGWYLPSMTMARAPDVPQSIPSERVEAGAARERGMPSRLCMLSCLSRVLVARQVTLRPHWREGLAVQLS